MGGDICSEACVDQQVPLRVVNEGDRGRELPLLAEGTARHRKRCAGPVGPGGQLEQRQLSGGDAAGRGTADEEFGSDR